MKKEMLLSTIVLGSLIIGGNCVLTNAEETEGNGANSNATVVFEENNKPTDPIVPPVDPTDPTDPNGPDKPTGNTEPLRIDIAPNFHFGKFTVGTGVKEASNTRSSSNLQVTDGRGTLEGWTVSVSRTDFRSDSHILPAVLKLTPGTVMNANNESVTLTGNVSEVVVVNSTPQPIFSANQNEGGGTYYQNFDNEKAKLEFNSDIAKKGLYTSELTWTLASNTNEGAR